MSEPASNLPQFTQNQPQGNEHAHIEPDAGSPKSDDLEVPYGGELGPSSVSVTDSVYEYTKENGRTYHGYRAGSYPFPNDPNETERLELQDFLFQNVFHGADYFAPLDNPKRIIDIGTGTGRWAISMGEAFPDAQVEGTDLSPIQPQSVPENVHFFIDDAEEEDWCVPENHYDFIHTRIMLGCFRDFKDIVKRSYRYLKPGGWMESQEPMSIIYCDDGTMKEDWPFNLWMKHLARASMLADRPLGIANKMKRWYEEAGYVDVEERVFKVPLNPWPKDPHMKLLGALEMENMLSGLQAFSLAYFTRDLQWTKDETEVYLVDVRKSVQDRNVHAYVKVHVVWGRKPFDWELNQNGNNGTESTSNGRDAQMTGS